jgi:two-component system response regulator YesN
MFKLLIVDDEKLIREGLATGFDWESLGFYVCGTAANGIEALKIIDKDMPDVIITDIKMPLMDGLDLIKHVNAKNKNTKFVVLSGYDLFDYAQKAINYGVTSYLLKPISEDELFPLMEKLHTELTNEQNRMEAAKTTSVLFERSKIDSLNNQLRKLLYDSSYYEKHIEDLFIEICPDINLNNMKVCLIYCHGMISSHIMYQQLSEYNNNSNRHFLVDGENIIFIYSSIKGETIVSEVLNILDENNPNIKAAENIVITLSSTFSGLTNLKQAYEEASSLLKHSFYNSPGKILVKPYSTDRKNDVDISSIADSVIAAILNGKEIEYKIKLREYFKKCQEQYLSKDILVLKIVDIYTSAIEQFDNINIQVNRNNVYSTLISFSSFNDFRHHVEELFNELFVQIQHYKSSSELPIVKRIENYINKNYGDRITLKSLSNLFHINPSYLSHLFYQKTGVSISNHIKNIRIQNAKRLLVSSDYRIHEIADMVGYKEYRYFCTVFKREVGKTPMEYRLSSITHQE